MKITIAKNAGFCFGVRRAINMVLKVRQKNPGVRIYTLGPIIHNPQVIDALKNRGIGSINNPSDPKLKHGDIVIIRAHGVSPGKRAILKTRGVNIVDATCPMVIKVHAIIKNASKDHERILIVGHKNHPEVESHLGVAGDKGVVIQDREDAYALPRVSSAAIVAQTTFDAGLFKEMVSILRQKVDKIDVFNTICESTVNRQKEVAMLAKKHDTFVVIGGRMSANTARLAEIARKHNKRVLRVESARELNNIEISSMDRIAVLAGASTPQWIIEECIDRLESVKKRLKLRQKLVEFLVESPLLSAIGSIGIAMATLVFVEGRFSLGQVIPIFFLSSAASRSISGALGWIMWAFCSVIAVSLGVVFFGGPGAALIGGIAVLRPLLCIRDPDAYLRSIYNLGMFILISMIVPLSTINKPIKFGIVLLLAYTVVHFMGSEILKGLKTIEMDSIKGRGSLVHYMGETKSILLLEYSIMILALALFLSYPLKISPALSYGLLAPLFFLAKGIDFYTDNTIFDTKLFTLYVDGLWLIVAFMAILWQLTMG
ncbi:MAG: 4-hydroxy-3-methylbut-2-enyl diphosphate reductase [Deltaproteobacteria bacterium]|nr:4-hydroxy-3-methylbut-2-enyl diphosphate reductase [Deltaproteobacteria bacterium]